MTILMLDMGNYKEINEVYATCKYYVLVCLCVSEHVFVLVVMRCGECVYVHESRE